MAARAATAPGVPTNLATQPTPITPGGAQQSCGTGTAFASFVNTGGVDSVALVATLNSGADTAPNYSAEFDVTDETTGNALTPIDSAGLLPSGSTVFVYAPVIDGHSYSWTVKDTDGTSWSSPAGPCDFISDTTPPLNPTVTSTDFPSNGGGLDSGEPGSFTLTSSDPAPAVGSGSGLKGFAYSFDQPLGVGGATTPANSDGSFTISGVSFGWGEHTLYAQAFDNADNASAQTQYSFYVPQNPELVPVLHMSLSGALSVLADGTASTGLWPIASCSFDFGDQSPVQTSTTCMEPHTYKTPGTYPVTLTITDQYGNKKSTTQNYTPRGSDYTPYGPKRLLDTRIGLGAPKAKVSAGGHVALKVAGVGSIPSNVTAVALNLTVTDTVANGYVDATPDNGSGATASNLNYLSGQTVTNFAIVPVAADGSIDLFVEGNAGGSADLIADVSGYFTAGSGDGYTPATPQRILDTRQGTGAPKAKVAANSGLPVAIAGADSIPTGVAAVAVHVTVVDTNGNGWIGAEPDGAGVPTTSILNYGKGQTLSNTVIVPVAADGKIELYNGGGSTSVDLLADVAGYFSPSSPDAYVPVGPFRAWDSRDQGNALTADGTGTYSLAPVPQNGPSTTFPAGAAVVANLTVVDDAANGYIAAYPAGTTLPSVSSLNYLAHQTVANLGVLATTGDSEEIEVYNHSTGSSDLLLDYFGYFSAS